MPRYWIKPVEWAPDYEDGFPSFIWADDEKTARERALLICLSYNKNLGLCREAHIQSAVKGGREPDFRADQSIPYPRR